MTERNGRSQIGGQEGARAEMAGVSEHTPRRVRHRGPGVQLNLNVRGLPPSATVAINERSDELLRQGRKVYKLGLGQSPFPVPEPVVEELRRHAHEKDYLPVKGLPELRRAVAGHHSREFGFEPHPDDILVGPGSKELMFLLQLVYYGDLIIPTPTWVSYAPQARIIGRHVRWLPTEAGCGWQITARQLDALCREDPGRPRIVILNYPANPTGHTYDTGRLERLARVARRYKVILLSDEIYAKLHHDGAHRSIVPMYPEGTIFSGGLSKWCGAGGWRLGFFVFPPGLRWLLDGMAAVASETFTSTSAPIQYAAVQAFRDGPDMDLYLRHSRAILKALGGHLAERLRATGARVISPQGAFYLFPDFSPLAGSLRLRRITTGVQLCERVLEDTGVAMLPGSAFGRPVSELTARISYVNFNGAEALEGIVGLPEGSLPDEPFLRRHCGETLEAIDHLCAWLRA